MKRFLTACALAVALLGTPAFAAWNTSLLSGPWPVPIYGAPVTDPVTGQITTPITGYLPGVVFVMPTAAVTPDLAPYAETVPAGVPVLAGVPSVALAFTSEDAAKGPLAAYWSEDQ